MMVIEDRHRQLAAAKEVPLLRLQAATRLPYTVFGVSCGLVIFLLMLSPGLFPLDRAVLNEVLAPALFFGATFAILASFTTPVYRGVANDLRALTPILPMDSDDVECLALGLTRATRHQIVVTVTIAFLVGLLHSYVLEHHRQPLSILIPLSLATISLWVVMVTTLSKMILNAAVFSRLGVMARPDLLRPSMQAPFGAAAIRPAMFVIGTWCAYPLLLVNDDSSVNAAVWLGFLVSLISLLGIVMLPLGGIRERIRVRRREILRTLDDRLEELHALDLGVVPAETLRDMDTILDMRERVAQAPIWPLDLAGVRRILLYIVLPPMTWAAAALVEMMIDGAM